MIGLHHLECFVRVAQTGSLINASRQLRISHSMLSRRLHNLEIRLGYRLFQRTGRGMEITENGYHLLSEANKIVQSVSMFFDNADALRGTISGSVCIGLPGSVATVLTRPLLQAIRETHPDIFIRFVELFSDEVENYLASGTIDVGLLYTGSVDESHEDIIIGTTTYYLIGHAGDEITAQATITRSHVAQCPLILPSRPHAVRIMVEEKLADVEPGICVHCEINSLSALKEVVAMNMGYAICAYDAVSDDIRTGRLQAARIEPPLAQYLVMRVGSKSSLTLATRTVVDAVRTICESLAA